MFVPGRRFTSLVGVALAALTASASAVAQSGPATPARQPKADPAALERKLLDGVQRNPDSFDARHILAAFYLQEGKIRAALPHLRRAEALDPSRGEVGYDLARALLETGQLDEARAQVT